MTHVEATPNPSRPAQVFGVAVALPLAFRAHASLAAAIDRAATLPAAVAVLANVAALTACILVVSLAQFELGRAPCRAVLAYGCLRG